MTSKTAVCTISTKSHIFKSKVLLQSARTYTNADLFCLITDSSEVPISLCGETYHLLDIFSDHQATQVKNKYSGNKLRWACKPLYLKYLLQLGYDKVIYVDNDICFFSSADFLFDELEGKSLLLTPHFYSINTMGNQNWLEANFRVGLYNAGFIGAAKKGLNALEWWADCCLYNVKKSAWRGLFDDQKYLDLMPVIFEDVKISIHKGCNVAGWNMEMCPRTTVGDTVVIADKWPIVFIHFASLTFKNILSTEDAELSSYLREYVKNLKSQNPIYAERSELRRTFKDYLLYIRHIRWRLSRLFE